MKSFKVFAILTVGGRLFKSLAATTEKALSPQVTRRVLGTKSSKSSDLKLLLEKCLCKRYVRFGQCSGLTFEVGFENSTTTVKQPLNIKDVYLPTECADRLVAKEMCLAEPGASHWMCYVEETSRMSSPATAFVTGYKIRNLPRQHRVLRWNQCSYRCVTSQDGTLSCCPIGCLF
ncbi:hypothetical protein ATANTOWER_001746 [Ataeniobius toweri]|uniref:Secreted protein n=1 Tax=Ataeniobius toweri TaxID=208326 RepID=A0ABU7C778_9TELE|nr:hypothetical protein [Ataeniobius toweri]